MSENWKQGVDSTYRYYAELNDEGSKYRNTNEDELNPKFLLPAASRLIEDEIRKKDELADEISKLKKKIESKSSPTIILEGESDYHIFKKSIILFFPEYRDLVQMVYPETSEHGGGGNFVKDNLISWEHLQIHEPPESRKQAIGLVDNDDEGKKARGDFSKIIKNNKYTKMRSYFTRPIDDSHFSELRRSALEAKIPPLLETLYPPEFWPIARDRGWLEKRKDKTAFISQEAKNKLASTSETFKTMLPDGSLRIYLTHQFDSSEKVAAAKYIAECPDDEARRYLSLFEPIVKDALEKLGFEV